MLSNFNPSAIPVIFDRASLFHSASTCEDAVSASVCHLVEKSTGIRRTALINWLVYNWYPVGHVYFLDQLEVESSFQSKPKGVR